MIPSTEDLDHQAAPHAVRLAPHAIKGWREAEGGAPYVRADLVARALEPGGSKGDCHALDMLQAALSRLRGDAP